MTKDVELELDLAVSRIIKARRGVVWRAWADPVHFAKWWAPAPIVTTVQKHEFYAGGAFYNTMHAKDGTKYSTRGCFLEVVEYERVVFTDALQGGWRPNREPFFSAVVTLQDHAGGTAYRALAKHRTEADRRKHADMGFEGGWATALKQLADIAENL